MQTGVLYTLLTVLRGVAVSGFSLETQVAGAAPHTDAQPPSAVARKHRQVMHNFHDMQYFGELTIGGQTITGLLDTGSFDLVVFDKSCKACGKAGGYSSNQSLSFRPGKLHQSLFYGSGSVEVYEASDQVAIGPYGEVNLTFWNGLDAMMPVLDNAAFQSIVGVGPPETPAFDTWGLVLEDLQVMKDDLNLGPAFPAPSSVARVHKSAALATLLGTQPTLVRANDVKHFSICLGQKPGSAGYFMWNDTSYLDTPHLFTRIKVVGKHTFTVNMTSLQLHRSGRQSRRSRGGQSQGIGCNEGCGAIVDSGTSLILMPYEAIDTLRDALKAMDIDCKDIRTLPKLTFKLDGKDFVLPPDAYISRGSPENAASATSSVHFERVKLDIGRENCELAVMGSAAFTNWGPLWILGMPFFRHYYTTFEIGRNHSERAIYTSPVDANCEPAGGNGDFAQQRSKRAKPQLRTVNRSAMLIPRIVQKARTHSWLKDL